MFFSWPFSTLHSVGTSLSLGSTMFRLGEPPNIGHWPGGTSRRTATLLSAEPVFPWSASATDPPAPGGFRPTRFGVGLGSWREQAKMINTPIKKIEVAKNDRY